MVALQSDLIENNDGKKQFNKYFKYIVAIIFSLSQLSTGCRTEVMGPSMPDFAFRTRSAYSGLAGALAMNSVGILIGNIGSSPLFVRFRSSILLITGVSAIWQGVITAALPWARSVWTLGLLICFAGLGQGAQLNGSHTLLIKLFGKRSGGILQFIHIGFGIGNVIGPQIVRPFFSPNMRAPSKKICGYNVSQSTTNNTDEAIIDSKIEYGFILIALFSVLTGFMMIVLFFLQRKYSINKNHSTEIESPIRKNSENKSFLSKIHPGIITNGKPIYGTCMLIGIFLFYLFQIVGASILTRFLTTFAMDRCKSYFLTQQRASIIQSLAAGCFTGSRFLSGFIINYRINLFLLVAGFLTLGTSVIYSFFARYYEIALWIGASALRFSYGPMFPVGTAWLNLYIQIDSPIITMAFVGATCGSFLGTLIGGAISENYSVLITPYVVFGAFAMMVIDFVVMLIMGEYHGKRDMNKEKECSQDIKENVRLTEEMEMEMEMDIK